MTLGEEASSEYRAGLRNTWLYPSADIALVGLLLVSFGRWGHAASKRWVSSARVTTVLRFGVVLVVAASLLSSCAEDPPLSEYELETYGEGYDWAFSAFNINECDTLAFDIDTLGRSAAFSRQVESVANIRIFTSESGFALSPRAARGAAEASFDRCDL